MDTSTKIQNGGKSLFVVLFFLCFFCSPLFALADELFVINAQTNASLSDFVTGTAETQTVSCSDLPTEGIITDIDFWLDNPDSNTGRARARIASNPDGLGYSPEVSLVGPVSFGWVNFDIVDFDLVNCSGSITVQIDGQASTVRVNGNGDESLYLGGSSNLPAYTGDMAIRINGTVPVNEHSFPLYLVEPQSTEFYLVSTTTCDTLVATNTICSYDYITATTSINVNTDFDFSPLYFQFGFLLFLMSIQTWYIMFVRK